MNPQTGTDTHEQNPAGAPVPGGLVERAEVTQARARRRPLLLGVAVVVVLLVAAGAFAWRSTSSAAPTERGTAGPGPVVMTKDQLLVVASSAGHSIYWAGAQGLDSYEVTIDSADVYVRYLPAGVSAGTKDPHLTVGTYEKAGAHDTLVSWAAVPGATSRQLAGGSLLVQPAGKATSAYFAFTGHDLLVEVYDPAPGRAYSLVESGAIQPIA